MGAFLERPSNYRAPKAVSYVQYRGFSSFADDVINLSVLKQNKMDLRFILYILYLALASKSYRNWTVLNAGEVVAGVAIARNRCAWLRKAQTFNPFKNQTHIHYFSCRHHELVFCYTIIEHNNRMMLPVATTSSSSRAVSSLSFMNQLDSFFPFDPYLLKR